MSKKLYLSLILSIIFIGSLVVGVVYKVFLNGNDNEAQQLSKSEAGHHFSVLAQKIPFSEQNCTNKNEFALLSQEHNNSSAVIPSPLDITPEQGNQITVLNLWYALENQDEDISVRLDPRIKEAKKIGLNSRIISTLEEDDHVQLPIIDDKKYLLKIKSIHKSSNNDIEIYGELNHNGKTYASTLSFTKKIVLALLTTPSGHFDIRMSNDKGYIYQSDQSDQVEAIDAVVDLPSFLN